MDGIDGYMIDEVNGRTDGWTYDGSDRLMDILTMDGMDVWIDGWNGCMNR